MCTGPDLGFLTPSSHLGRHQSLPTKVTPCPLSIFSHSHPVSLQAAAPTSPGRSKSCSLQVWNQPTSPSSFSLFWQVSPKRFYSLFQPLTEYSWVCPSPPSQGRLGCLVHPGQQSLLCPWSNLHPPGWVTSSPRLQ